MAYRFKSRGLGFTLQDLSAAITRQEGTCSSFGVCRNNNPGNLTPRAGGWPGQVGVDSRGIAIFDSFDSGQMALLTQEQANVNRGLSLSQFFGGVPGGYPGFAPATAGNNPGTYTSNVASWLGGVDPNAPISSLLDSGGAPVSSPGLPDDSGQVSASDSGLSTASWIGIGVLVAGLALTMR